MLLHGSCRQAGVPLLRLPAPTMHNFHSALLPLLRPQITTTTNHAQSTPFLCLPAPQRCSARPAAPPPGPPTAPPGPAAPLPPARTAAPAARHLQGQGAEKQREASLGMHACTTARTAACAAPLANARSEPARAWPGGAAGQAAAGYAGGGEPCSRAWALATAPRAESSCARSSSTLRRSSVSSLAARLSCTAGDQGGVAQRHIAVGTGGADLRPSAAAVQQRRRAWMRPKGRRGPGRRWRRLRLEQCTAGWRKSGGARQSQHRWWQRRQERLAHLAGDAGSGSPPLEQLQCTVEWALIPSASGTLDTLDTVPRWAGKPAAGTGRSWVSCSTPRPALRGTSAQKGGRTAPLDAPPPPPSSR